MIQLEVISPSTRPTGPSTELFSVGASVPIGTKGKIHITGRNDMPTPQKMGCTWVVKDPEGLTVEEHTDDWAGWPWPTDVDPDDTHEFISFLDEGFDLEKLGTYSLAVSLLMNPDSPVIVDSYEGDLCTTTLEVPPEFELIQHTIHPASYVWEGEEEVCIIEFPLTPEQIPFTQWGGLKLADAFASAVEAEGNSLLEVKVYEDTTPLFWTNYRVEIMAAVASEEQGVAAPVWPWLVAIGAVLVKLPWAFIIKGTLAIIGIWLVGWIVEKLIKAVDRVIHKPPALTDEIIDSLGREDLIPMILYKAPRLEPPYEVTPEELEAMSDDGLRALLKELRDRQIKPFPWELVAIAGGLGILGVGVAIALTANREEAEIMQETLIGYAAPPSGPSYIGQLAEVAVGAYTEIEAIIAPAQATPGDLVTVEARVRNLHTGTIYIATTGRYDSVDILPTEDYATVDPGETRSFYFSFTMPPNDVELRVWSFYWTGDEWYQDDYSYVDIALVVVAPPVAGEVTIQLRNPPGEAENWSLTLTDWDMTVPIHFVGRNGKQRLDIAEATTFEIPEGIGFPLRVASLQLTKWNPEGTALIQLYYAQSMHPTLWDWDKGDWGDEPDPYYRELFIPGLGSYHFDVAAEELYEVIPALALWPLAIVGLGILGIGATVAFATMARPRG